MTRLRLTPRSLRGPLGPLQPSPLTALQQSFSIPFQVHLVLFFGVFISNFSLSSLSCSFISLSELLEAYCPNKGTIGSASACCFHNYILFSKGPVSHLTKKPFKAP